MSAAALALRGAATGERWTLAGGHVLHLRPLAPGDAAAEQVFFNGLSLDSRVLRFHFGLRELSPSLLKLLTEVDQRLHRAWVLVLPGPEGAIVADARFVADPARTGAAEFALAVADAWQGRGLGRRLMAHLITEARRQGLRELSGDVLADNRRMLALLRDLGVRLLGHPDGPQLIRAEMTLN
ncbi:GNAT family N-acetyltransferase [Pelomonas sp. P7]|uniref:GNAT family N-acetyltransferase n=1 Tax=Pelomonas caseinilytica TaxID=2906763 RepID=A0ABS8XCG3_9BURK|nr:GNAT family N-acetyltransferase [Pelomonas sp. P7]